MTVSLPDALSESSQPEPGPRPTRQRRQYVAALDDERALRLEELAHKLNPSFDFFLFCAICALLVIPAILFDSPALYVLAALFIPFLAPVLGLPLSGVISSGRLFLETLVATAMGGLALFAGGVVAGLLASLFPALTFEQAIEQATFSAPNALLLTVGVVFSIYMVVRAPRQKPLVPNIALGYALFLPAAVAGFGLTSRLPGLFPDGLVMFVVHLVWAILVGMITFTVLGYRPRSVFGYALGISAVALGALVLVLLGGISPAAATAQPVSQPPPVVASTTTPTPSPTLTGTVVPPATSKPGSMNATATATNTLVPSLTPSKTVTPQPTPVWALIAAPEGNGAVIRKDADSKSPIISSLLNGSPVKVIGDPVRNNNVLWVQVETENGIRGWMVQELLITQTPAPAW
jgi:hypothetical protein